jgi:hypothetical protein
MVHAGSFETSSLRMTSFSGEVAGQTLLELHDVFYEEQTSFSRDTNREIDGKLHRDG